MEVYPSPESIPRFSHLTTPATRNLIHLSVGGMTCASCVRALTEALSSNEGASEVSVNLLGKSASLIISSHMDQGLIVESVEAAGYECRIISSTPITPVNYSGDTEKADRSRTVELEVKGIPNLQCGKDIMDRIDQFSMLSVLKPINKYPEDIVRLSYTPCVPEFTIRTILSAISSVAPPSVTVAISRPLSFEDATLQMHIQEQRSLFLRLVVAALAAIPTLIIGIIYMSLVPRSNLIRQFFQEAVWTGQLSRGEVVLFFLSTPVMFYSAADFHRRSLKELWVLWRPGTRVPLSSRFFRFGSMNLLISLGVSVAYFSSVAELAISASRSYMHGMSAGSMGYFDSVVFLTLFLLIGKYIEAFSKRHAASAVSSLTKLQSSEAFLVFTSTRSASKSSSSADLSQMGDFDHIMEKTSPLPSTSDIQKIPTELLEVGDIVRVPPGGTPPADGTIVSSEGTHFDESSLTGESRNVQKKLGDQVYVGTINKVRVVNIRVDAIGGETMLDQIIEVVRQGQTKRAPIERLADVITSHFVPIVITLAIVTWLVWLGLGLSGILPSSEIMDSVGGWPSWSLEFAIAVFIIACPCGIGLAAPTALLVGSGLAAKHGILVRGGGEAFQEASKIDIMVFDKTGTLTEGSEPKVTDVVIDDHASNPAREHVAEIVMQLASASSHPLCLALRRYFPSNANPALSTDGFELEEIPGRGMKGTFRIPDSQSSNDVKAIMGNETFLREHGATPTQIDSVILHKMKAEGKSVVLLAIAHIMEANQKEDAYLIKAIFAISDPVRPEAPTVIAQLRAQGIETWIISGDNAVTAGAVAKSVGIPEANVIAGVLPQQKAEKIRWLQNLPPRPGNQDEKASQTSDESQQRRVVAMVGDGINDAPALTEADIGIAIGSGSDVALSSAKFVLLTSNLQTLLTLTDLSKKVFRRIKFNFAWAMVYNLVALPIAAGVIYPAGHAKLDPVWSSLAMALSSSSVVCSSLLLRFYKPPHLTRPVNDTSRLDVDEKWTEV